MAGRADGREARQGGGKDTRGEGEERSSEVPCRARRSPQARQQHVAVCTNCLLKEAAAPPPKLMADAPVPTATAEPKADAPVPSAEPKVDTPAPIAEPMPVGQVRFRDHCSCYAPFINDVVEVLELSRSARGLAQRTPFSASSSAPSSSASSGVGCDLLKKRAITTDDVDRMIVIAVIVTIIPVNVFREVHNAGAVARLLGV